MNTFGTIFRLTAFGESHGPAIGGIIDGAPAGLRLDEAAVQRELDARRPGNSPLASQRRESDKVTFLSGLLDGVTLGTPIGFVIPNTDARSSDYEAMRRLYRPNHADFTYDARYGVRDWRGGGRASARETACRVVAGAVARQYLATQGIEVKARLARVGEAVTPEAMADEIKKAREEADSVGGLVECIVKGMPAGVGEPLFDKLQATLGAAMMSIPGAKAFEVGDGTALSACRGSQVLDIFTSDACGRIVTTTNHSGGLQGGITTGMPVVMRVTFKPTPTIPRDLPTVDDHGRSATLNAHGRHDPCIALRAVPVVEAMACITMLDAMLLRRVSRL